MAPSVLVEHTCRQKELKKNSQEVLTAMVGKTQRVSRGYSTGFVPDYRYAVETIGESEGLGSSGRFEMDRTASDDSFALKRKCISLNVDISNGFGIPLQVISLAKMSRYEKKELEQRLKSELEQIQNLQRKLQPWFTSIASLSGLGDGRVPAEDLHRSSELLSSGQGKKRGPPGRSGPNLKRGFSGRFQAVKRVPLSNSSDLKLMKQCEALLKRLMDHPYGWVFNSPVDTVKLNIPDYLTVIKHPMDLGTVKSKLAKKEYSSPLEFLADVRLTFSNAMTYNPPGNDVHAMADQLSKIFEMRWKSIEKKLPVNQSAPDPVQLGVSRETLAAKSVSPSKKRKTSLGSHDLKTEPVAPTMTDEEKHSLGKDIEALIGELPLHIIDLLRNQSSGANQTGEDEIEVDIDELSNDTLFTLRKLVDEFVQEKQANQKKAEPSDIEILNVSGPSNSSLPPRKGNDPVDEDVDILGNDPPVSSYAPVEIDKDTARRSSKSSSSSSSSDSGSSSSDSGSSSGSDSNHAKASFPMNVVKEVLGSGETVNHQANGLDPHDGNQAVSGVDQVEQSSQLKPPFVEVESRQEGKSAPSERQVLPDKLYRAALLRGRFADTILKAREKTLNEGEKGDPEKLRRFREDLERQQREEKNRLQAEAKAAEDARIEAAKEAAAAAKRKRELEREAARQALLQMEKTVEINENAKFLEDLEMLRSASAAVDLPYVEETSHGQSEDSMSCFNFQGSSNPLEQLGLYMRMDDDEDEEVAPDNVASENEEGVVPDREEVAPYAHRDNDEVAAENVALNQEEEGALDRVYAENDEVTANNVILDKEEAPHNVYKDNNEVAEDDVGLGKEEEGVAMDIDEVAAGNVALKREAEEPAPHNVNADNDEVAAEDVTLDKEEEEVAMAVDEVAAGNVAVEREEEAALDEVYADKVEVAAEEVALDKEEEVAPDNVYANSYKAAADDVALDDEKEEVAKDNVNVDNDEVAMDSVYVDNEKEEDAPDNVYAVNDEDVAGDTVCLDNKEAPTNIYLDNGNIVADNVGSENQEGVAHQNVYAVNDEDVAGDSVCLDNEEAPTNIYLDNGNIVADNVGLENQEGVAHQSVYGDNDEVDDVALDNEEEVAPQNVTVANEGVDDVALDNEKKEIGLVNVYADNGDVVADNVAMDIEKRVAPSNVCADNGKVAGENVCLGNEKEDSANTDNEVAAGSDAADDDEVTVDNEEEVVLGNVYADNDEVAAENIASCNEEEGVALNNCADNNEGAVENVGSGHEKEQGTVENVYVDTDEVAADNVALDKEEECASDVFGDKAEVAVDDVGLKKEEEVGPSNVYEDSEEVAVANVAADKKEEVAPHDVCVDKTEVALNVVSDTPSPPQVQQDVEGGEVD